MDREIKYIVIHCTATSQDAMVESIQNYWKEKLNWKNAGYHFIIDYLGKVTQLQDLNKLANGVKGYNQNSIHVSWIGGQHTDNRTAMQKRSLANIIRVLRAMFPEAEILGHKDFPKVTKSCPRFDVAEFVEEIDDKYSDI